LTLVDAVPTVTDLLPDRHEPRQLGVEVGPRGVQPILVVRVQHRDHVAGRGPLHVLEHLVQEHRIDSVRRSLVGVAIPADGNPHVGEPLCGVRLEVGLVHRPRKRAREIDAVAHVDSEAHFGLHLRRRNYSGGLQEEVSVLSQQLNIEAGAQSYRSHCRQSTEVRQPHPQD
jgi:hypothetical protein